MEKDSESSDLKDGLIRGEEAEWNSLVESFTKNYCCSSIESCTKNELLLLRTAILFFRTRPYMIIDWQE